MFLKIMVLTPIRGLFDYLPPETPPSAPLVPGLRVLVPFGKKKQNVGVIYSVNATSDYPCERLKAVIEVLDDVPAVTPTLFQLALWLQRYYHCSMGDVWNLMLPKPLRAGKPNEWPKRLKPPTFVASDTSAPISAPSYVSQNTPGPVNPNTELHPNQATPNAPHALNPAQTTAIQNITAALGTFQPFLLEGVTGSGKTEVYLQTIERVLQKQQQALVLVPEIALTPQTIERFQQRFPVPIAILHSGISETKRFYHWKMAAEGLAPIVIGTRSAAFAPLKNPGVFIIDEEHDLSFKQQEGLRYSARDTLIRRAQLEHCPIVLGTATPSLESICNAQQGKYQRLRLPQRVGHSKPPTVKRIYLKQDRGVSGISRQLKESIARHLAKQSQVLLFLNRRGFSRLLMCQECGWKGACSRCDTHLIYHQQKQVLKCHHCLGTQPFPNACPACQVSPLKPVGLGTEKVEQTLLEWFPHYPVVRIDRDVILNKTLLEQAIAEIHTEQPMIILGTQMISKGHHFKKVTLVGILDIDSAFFAADFRSQERLGQLIVQVAGRAGREERLGEVMLQTHFPEHPLLEVLLASGYPAFAEQLLQERRLGELPPFSHQVLWRAESKHRSQALSFLEAVRDLLRSLVQTSHNRSDPAAFLSVLGPIPALMEKKMGHYRAQLIVQASHRKHLHPLIACAIEHIGQNKWGQSVRWSVDIDPQEMG